jgi:hypothetical protein
MRFRILTLALACLGLSLRPGIAAAQAPPSVERLTVSFWPEYDQPEVLVIVHLQLAASTPLPTQLRVPIPTSVSTLNAVATRNDQDTLVNADFTRETVGELSYVVVESDSLDVQVEFYIALERLGDTRSFTFNWPGGLTAADFVYEVQEPVEASEFVMEPTPQGQGAGDFGLTYRRASLGILEATDSPALSVSYARTTDRFSADFVGSQTPLGTPGSPGGGTPDLAAYLPWALLAIGLVLMAGGAIYYVRMMRPSDRSRRRHRPTTPDSDGEPASVYCHNCGAPATATDSFCRRCGTALRR